jgi:Leucine-rich repeat (LRR) protein
MSLIKIFFFFYLNINKLLLLIYLELCALKLINFDCSFNRIVRLPLNLREMNSLIELHVEHNPLEIPPASVRKNFF